MAAYRMTPARRRALRKAQMASARKRRGKGKGKLAVAHRKQRRNNRLFAAAVVGGVVAGAVYGSTGGTKYLTRREYNRKSADFKARNPRKRVRYSFRKRV